MFGKKNVTRHDLEIKPCSSLGWIKHKLSQERISVPTVVDVSCSGLGSAYPKGNLHFENGENLVAELIRVNARLLHIRRRCRHSAAALYRLNDA
ncbi:hypothetical protein F2Q70_00024763 [Brassica cretica]|uniref:Uncharacterized protein n=1 Tax=Brassica cretica TaxID=69181 RepID=A0A8S9LGZ4_BRACR|nr:hypothetical protein F2Q70_00024763 [Brassica cretica]